MEYINKKIRKHQKKHCREMEKRKIFMQELSKVRAESTKSFRKIVKENIGPSWYQVLTVQHIMALDTLPTAIYQDILEGRPVRTMNIIRILGIFPRPKKIVIQHCMFLGREDPKEFLAQLFFTIYNHSISGKRYAYDLNMRIILSSIFYLGLDDLIKSLRELFRPEEQISVSPTMPRKERSPVPSSPYLQKMVAPLYRPSAPPKRKPPPPLPDLSFLNQHIDEESITVTSKPPPPQPSASQLTMKTRNLPLKKCDKLAGYDPIKPIIKPKEPSQTVVVKTPLPPTYPRLRSLKSFQNIKKKYGIGHNMLSRRKKKHLKPQPPSTGIFNVQYNIVGVYNYRESSFFIIGDVFTLPPQGVLVNGGHALFPNGEYGLIHLGFGGCSAPTIETCECMEKWERTIFRHLENTKCNCGHRYDYGNEGTFPEEELQYFQQPTRKGPMSFDYNVIYELDPKSIQVQKEIRKIWENDSVLNEDDPDDSELAEKKKKRKKKKEVLKKMSEMTQMTKPCLGDQPTMDDYLRCAMRYLGRLNVAARLPDVDTTPELRAWMRRRIHGPLTSGEKNAMLKRSISFWSYFKTLYSSGLGRIRVALPSDPSLSALTTWKYKSNINRKFRDVMYAYKVKLYGAQSYSNNILWSTTYSTEYPDKNFRETFFSYLAGQAADVALCRPYCRYETFDRVTKLCGKRYACPPKGAGNIPYIQ